jgi:2-polyprenyl-6-methoxyphenol hydroxylase-like FAD-dependent oxidoreductase
MVPQWDLLNLLAAAAQEEPSFSLRMRTEMTGLIREEGRVRGVRYRTDDGQTGEIRADLTVACDGRWSDARRESGLRPHEFPVPIDAWWFRLPRMPEDRLGALTPRAGRGRFAVVIPRDRYLQIAYIGAKGTDPQLRARGIERFRQDITELMPEFADRIDALASMDDVKYLDVRPIPCVAAPSSRAIWPRSAAAGCCPPCSCRTCSGSCTATWWRRSSTADGGAVRPSRCSHSCTRCRRRRSGRPT